LKNLYEIVKFRSFSGSHYIPVPVKILKTIKWKPGDILKIQVINGKLLKIEKLEVK